MILSLSLSSSGYCLLEKWWQKVITVLSAPGYALSGGGASPLGGTHDTVFVNCSS